MAAARAAGVTPERFRTVGIVAGRVALMASAIIAVRIYTEFLSPLEVGRMNLILSIYQWFSVLFVSPVGLFVLRQSNTWHVEGVFRWNLRRMSAYFSLVACLAAAVVVVVQKTVGFGVGVSAPWLAWLVGGQLLFVVLAGTNASLLNNLGRSWWFVGLGNIGAWLGLAVATFLCLRYAGRAEYWLTGLLAGQVVACAASVLILGRVYTKRSGHITSARSATPFALGPVWAFASPIVPITLAYWCQTDGFRFVLQRQVGTSELGLFLVAFTLGGTPVLAVERLLIDLLSPAFYRQIASKDLATMKAAWEEYARRLLPAMAICVAFAASSGILLAQVLVSERYQAVGVYAVYGALFRGCFVAAGVFLMWTHAIERTASPLAPYVVGAVMALVGVAVLSPLSVMHGPGVALVVSAASTLGLLAHRMRTRYALVLPWRRLLLATIASCPLIMGGLLLGVLLPSSGRSWGTAALVGPVTYCLVMAAVFAEVVGARQTHLEAGGIATP